jgi:hypothetical protein
MIINIGGDGSSNAEVRKFVVRTDNTDAMTVDSLGNALFTGGITTSKLTFTDEEDPNKRTVGTGTIESGSSQVTILNSLLTEKSLIYLTPVSKTWNRVLYVKQQDNTSFVVGLDGDSLNDDVKFNWWIIN